MKVDHLSPSQINTYLRCPMQYYYRYCEGMILPPRAAMTVGSCVHYGVECNYWQKKDSRKDLPAPEVIGYYEQRFDQLSEETDWGDDDPGEHKDKGVSMISVYHENISPIVQPKEMELNIPIPLVKKVKVGKDVIRQKTDMTCIIDVVDDSDLVIETKTTSRSPTNPPPPHHVLQTTLYTEAYRRITNVAKRQGRIDYAVHKKKPVTVSYTVQPDDGMVAGILQIVANVWEMVERELWTPNWSTYLCNERWCGYWNLCQKKFGGNQTWLIPEKK